MNNVKKENLSHIRKNEPIRSVRNLKRKGLEIKTYSEKIKEEILVDKTKVILNNLKIGDYIQSFDTVYKIVNFRAMDRNDLIKTQIVFSKDSWRIGMNWNVCIENIDKILENYVEPVKENIIINSNSIANMEFLSYNIYIIEGLTLSYQYFISISDSRISCGVKQFSEINKLFDIEIFKKVFKDNFRNTHNITIDIKKKDFDLFCKKVMEYIFNNYKKCGFLIVSTNENGNKKLFKKINDLLSNYDFITFRDTVNPNTNNKIRFWTCNLFEYQKTLIKEEKVIEKNELYSIQIIENPFIGVEEKFPIHEEVNLPNNLKL